MNILKTIMDAGKEADLSMNNFINFFMRQHPDFFKKVVKEFQKTPEYKKSDRRLNKILKKSGIVNVGAKNDTKI